MRVTQFSSLYNPPGPSLSVSDQNISKLNEKISFKQDKFKKRKLERLQKLYVEPSQTQYNVSERFEPSNAYSASSFSRRSLPGLGVAQDILSRMMQGNAPSIHGLSRCLAQWLQLLCWLVLMLKPTVLKSNMVSHTMAITV